MKKYLFLIILLGVNYLALAQKVAEPSTTAHPEWSKPYPPFQIAGNLYYVGTYDLACYLIVTPKGNILINTGLASSAPVIKTGIEALGFKLADTKILLTTQAHYDHMGAMAAIKKLTGAKMMVDAGDAAVLADGGRSDYALGSTTSPYAPVKADRLLHNGDTVKLGGMSLVVLHHPGHTKGSCSFLFDVKDSKRKYRVLIANLPTIITDKKFSEIPAYPHIAADYAYTLAAMKKLTFDIWLASHASQFGLYDKHRPGSAYNPAAFIDRKGYDAQLKDLQAQFTKKINEK
ncbi:subclass B3 metallo-beta-lactamase [Mucilaginibacter sp. UR6-11]|uniref:subclass B3 metallo-beta-lactamase n=1 Tax=Mucilaginibacter sp. UR6-11 TaxID=1435644 RepID=UPI001E390743|nr:subclass B3 metallo-beta-lactamase [Mucilaginibacter sp. UR6-11]MCC8424679.1 subclass B3 metallo-beta-lactamase [Mucilaginibacter sp. UR6-11]